MGFFDSLFGGESTKGIKFQRADNERRQEFVEEQTKQARQDILDIIPRGQETLRQGYSAAVDVARRAPQTQLDVLSRTNQRAQESLLGGMNEYRRAIMGLPSGMDPNNYYNNDLGLRPQRTGAGADPASVFWKGERPAFLQEQLAESPDALAQAQALFPEQFTGGGFSLIDIGNYLR